MHATQNARVHAWVSSLHVLSKKCVKIRGGAALSPKKEHTKQKGQGVCHMPHWSTPLGTRKIVLENVSF